MLTAQQDAGGASPLDLHGCDWEEALVKLEQNLVVWVNYVIMGSYPFVRPAIIVTGCGN